MITPDITRLSPNVNDAPMPAGVKTLIVHATRSGVSMNPTEFTGTLNYMATAGTTSSHWVISRTGLKARVVNDNRQAWHAGYNNDNAWGIELEQGVEADGFTEVQITALVEVCEGYRDDFGVPAVHVFNENDAGFIGHQETAQGRSYGKTDPGHLFPWDDFVGRLAKAVPVIAGIGAHYADGSDEEIWTPRAGKDLDGVGARYTDGSVVRLWPT